MNDLDILKLLSTKENWDRFSPYIKPEYFTREGQVIHADYAKWYDKNPMMYWGRFCHMFRMMWHSDFDAEKLEVFNDLLERIDEHDLDDDFKDTILKGLIERDYAHKILDISMNVAEGNGRSDMEDVINLVADMENEVKHRADIEDYIVTSDIEAVLSDSTDNDGYSWRMKCLNKALGPLCKGNLVVVSSRPDGGKTTFLASETSNMIDQMDGKKILWVNNEQGGMLVKSRVIQSYVGCTTDELKKDKVAISMQYLAGVDHDDKIIMMDKPDVRVSDVELFLRRNGDDIGLIVFDTLSKVHGFEKKSGGQTYKREQMVYQWARELAKMYAPVISVHQAGHDAEGVKWITMDMLHESKTGVQGEADAIITIGQEPGNTGEDRFIFVPKNKMYGEDPSVRNGRFNVAIKKDIARFEDK